MAKTHSRSQQLKCTGKAMQVLINKLDRSTLDEQERHAIEAFKVQLREINQLKKRRG
ncbi:MULTISPECIES: hypothetical protein [Pseudomonadota]|uniref:hypothetical protein n=1 Tax=Pseudomonadota TaxID=1224 RepID=UPI003297F02E